MTETILILSTGFLCIACFIIGAQVGQKASKGEKVEMPNLNPFKAYRNMESKKSVERKQAQIDVIMQNIETYNGTSKGQKDVPKG